MRTYLSLGLAISALNLMSDSPATAQQKDSFVVTQSLFEAAKGGPVYSFTPGTAENHVHIFPTAEYAHAVLATAAATATPLIYHGGPIMPSVTSYVIFWVPPKLQDGTSTVLSSQYQKIQDTFLADYPAHGVDNNNTQYYQASGGVKTYVNNVGSFSSDYVDTSPYPASACNDSITPKNCITDAQIQAEVKKVMALKGWKGGVQAIFLVYTSKGEGSCFDLGSTSCAYTQYCAYHGAIQQTPPVIYANMPYGDSAYCQNTGVPSPNGNADATVGYNREMSKATTFENNRRTV